MGDFERGIDTCGDPLHLLDALGVIWITLGLLLVRDAAGRAHPESRRMALALLRVS